MSSRSRCQLRLHRGRLLLELGDLALDLGQALLRARRSSFSRSSAARSTSSVMMRRSRLSIGVGVDLDLHLQARRGLVDEIDRLVGQLARRDVAMRQPRGRDSAASRMRMPWWTSYFSLRPRRIAIVSSTRRLVDHHRLEPALERLVLLDVLAVLVERRRADAAQLAARRAPASRGSPRRPRLRRRRRRRACAARR